MTYIIKCIIAWAGSSFITAFFIALFGVLEGIKSEKNLNASVFAIGFFMFIMSFIIGFISVLLYSFPLLITTWIPLWFFRKGIFVFDDYMTAGMTGLSLGFLYWLILSHIDPHFRETLNRQLSTKIMFCTSTIAGSTIMFLYGCFFKAKEIL